MPWPTQILLVETTGVPLEFHNTKINKTWSHLSRHAFLDEFLSCHNLAKGWGCWPKRGSFQGNHTRHPFCIPWICSSPASWTSGSHFSFHLQGNLREETHKTSSLPDQEMMHVKGFCKQWTPTCFSPSQSVPPPPLPKHLELPSNITFITLQGICSCDQFPHYTVSH